MRKSFQIRLSGLDPDAASDASPALHRVSLHDYPMENNLKSLATMPSREVELQTFKGAHVEGHKDQIHQLTLARLDAGDASFVISGGTEADALHMERLAEGAMRGVPVPVDCLPRYARNELELMPGYISDLGDVRPEVERELQMRCLYEGAIYQDGKQWEATHKKCQMCSCQR